MRRQRRKKVEEAGELNMVALIDVAMQLLNFFLITAAPMAVITNLDVFRPSPEAKQEKLQTPPKMIRIQIYPDGYTINDRAVGLKELDGLVARLAGIDKKQSIMIMAAAFSRHEDLIHVLNLCAKYGLENLSVISTN